MKNIIFRCTIDQNQKVHHYFQAPGSMKKRPNQVKAVRRQPKQTHRKKINPTRVKEHRAALQTRTLKAIP